MAVLLLGALAAASLANASDVKSSHDPDADFAGYRTYAWRTNPRLGPNHPLAEGSPLDEKIRAAGDEALGRAGLTAVDVDPDLLVTYVGFVRDYMTVEGERRELADGIAWIGAPYAHATIAYQEGTLVFELLDGDSEELVWSGWASEVARTPEKLRKKAERATARILRHFPPSPR